MANTVHAFDFLSAKETPIAPVCALYGDEPFLKSLVSRQIVSHVVGDDVPFARFDGKALEWRDLMDELATVSLFGGGGPRLAMVEDADDFVSKHRTRLEEYVKQPKSSGILVLQVGAWPGNTRLYKELDKHGLQIECRPPEKAMGKRKVLDESRLCKWIVAWAKREHDIKLDSLAAQLLLDIVGPELGMLEQDLAKLALYVEPGGTVTAQMVRDKIGGWRAKTIWELLDAAADGDAGDALLQLDRLLRAGAEPLALFGSISWSFRRFAAAVRVFQQAESRGRRISLRAALERAGFRKWPQDALETAERQLRQLTRHRASQLYRWLLEADLALKGSHSQPHRARDVLEQLFLRMARRDLASH